MSAPVPGGPLSGRGVETVVVARTSDLGGFEVRRALPTRQRRMVGPFVFLDRMGPTVFRPGEGLDVRPHPTPRAGGAASAPSAPRTAPGASGGAVESPRGPTVHDEELAQSLRRLQPDAKGGCLPACCALAVEVLLGRDALGAQAALAAGFSAMPGGATFAGARVLLARLFGARADVVSGPLERILALSGRAGLVILGVEPRLLYPGAAPGRHAILLTSCREGHLPRWAAGLLEPVPPGPAETVSFVDPSRPVPPRRALPLQALAAAFDGAGREGLLVEAPRS